MSQNFDKDLEIIGLPAFRDNRIWCINKGREMIVVDPGDAGPVLDYIEAQGFQLSAVLLTHHHSDHIGGVEALCEKYPETTIYGPAAESITGISRPLSGGECLSLLGRDWHVMAVPGHTRGHLAYWLDGGGGRPCRLFCGDVLFGLGCGRLFEGTAEQMLASLNAIAVLPDDAAIYCAHEYTALNLPFAETVMPDNRALQVRAEEIRQAEMTGRSTLPFSLAEEKLTNPFLRCADPEVILAASKRARLRGVSLEAADQLAVFSTLREWRNHF